MLLYPRISTVAFEKRAERMDDDEENEDRGRESWKADDWFNMNVDKVGG